MVLNDNDPNYQQCNVTVMDNIADPDIFFDANGVSNYALQYKELASIEIPPEHKRVGMLEQLIDSVKKAGKNRTYDCITGVSGGIDSSYLIYKAKEWGLRPLIVHFDNGWNTEIAVNNIKKIIEKTGFDLFTIVVDWLEFRDLQLSFIKAGVIDLEVPTDHAIASTWYKLAGKYGVTTILSGGNIATEAILPSSWIYNKTDSVSLLNIHKQFGQKSLKTYPIFGFKEKYLIGYLGNIEVIKPLNLIDYNKEQAKDIIKSEFGWVDYGGKHYESFYTKFYQAYILPRRFKVDKRKPHLSNLILSGQITRQDALDELKVPLYSTQDLEKDKEFFLKKLGITNDEFEMYMALPRLSHQSFGQQLFITEQYPILNLFKPAVRLIRGFKK